MFNALLCGTAKNWNQPKYHLTREKFNKMWNFGKKKYYTPEKMNRI
jgi:hypothetical protein